ncbi:MAG TPA: hypothetical protein VML55_20340 [Planctomycetaceae bacterium]|nr:hypothetical protein [Planctomycetaceae bacterium]
MSKVPQAFPFLLPEAELSLYGTFQDKKGGYAIVRAERREEALYLGRSRFAVLAILALAAKGKLNLGGAALPGGFVSRGALQDQFNELASGAGHADYVVRYVHGIRKSLRNFAEAHAWAADGRAWAHRLLESNGLGYRISIPPDRLHPPPDG